MLPSIQEPTELQANFTREYARQCQLTLPGDKFDRKRYPQRDFTHFRRYEQQKLICRPSTTRGQNIVVWIGPRIPVFVHELRLGLGSDRLADIRAEFVDELIHWSGVTWDRALSDLVMDPDGQEVLKDRLLELGMRDDQQVIADALCAARWVRRLAL